MKNKTILEIENFGPINKAKIDIGGISIITGDNASGKTTSSKLLYCFLASVSSDGKELFKETISRRINNFLGFAFENTDNSEEQHQMVLFASKLRNECENLIHIRESYVEIKKYIDESSINNNKSILNQLDKLHDIIFTDLGNNKKLEKILTELINLEFDGVYQFFDSNNESKIMVSGNNDCEYSLSISLLSEDRIKIDLNNELLDCIQIDEVSYLETPYIMELFEDTASLNYSYHQKLLMNKLKYSKHEDMFEETDESLLNIIEKINGIIQGKIKYEDERFEFEEEGYNFTLKNTAAGMKQFGIIKRLINNGKIPKGGFLIMDEPEVHLHPKWQLALAEIVSLLTKYWDITFYINSHSPSFIEAVEAYSKSYGLDDVNFYVTVKSENSGYDFKRIDRNNIKEIYSHLGDIYKEIDIIKGKNDANDIRKEVGL